MNDETSLAVLTEGQRMLAEAKTVEDFRNVRDYATTAQKWAKTRHMGVESENMAAEVVLRAERAIGLMLIRMAETGERAPAHSGMLYREPYRKETALPTVADLLPGVARNAAYKWQALARQPEDRFEAALAVTKRASERIAKVNFYRGAPKASPVRARDILVEDSQDDETPGFARVARAFTAIGQALHDLPDDELMRIPALVATLADQYQAERTARRG